MIQGGNGVKSSPITLMASLSSRILAPARAKLRMSHNTGVLAVEENVLDILVLEIGALKDIFEIGLSEACRFVSSIFKIEVTSSEIESERLTLRLNQYIRAIVKAGGTCLIGQTRGNEGEDCERN